MTVTGSRGLPDDEVPVRLTPRQRQVIALIERGYTNAEIAAELGVSLDGAKWHVREIMSVLGVDSREEAAEYWRRRNGMASRFQRLRRALSPRGWPQVAAIFVTAAFIAGAFAVGAFFLFGDDDPAEPAATVTVEPSPTATDASPTPAPSPTPTPDPDIGPDGVPIEEFEVGPPVDILADGVLYWSWAGIEGPRQNLYRGYRTTSGETVIEDLYERLPPRTEVAATAFDIHSGRVAVLLCRVGYCGGYGPAEPDSEAYLTLSTDYGVTWSEPARVPFGWFPVIFIDQGLLIVQFGPDNYGPADWAVYPRGDPFVVPDGSYPAQLGDGTLVFSSSEAGVRTIVDVDGTVLFVAPPPPPNAFDVEPILALPTLDWTFWYTNEPDEFVGNLENASFTRVFRMDGGGLYFYAPHRDETVLGRWDAADHSALRPVLIDLDAGVVSPISDLGETQGYFAPYGFVHGAFAAAIPGAGDCLNVRTAPSLQAPVIECVPDGVLLELTGETASADGTDWRAVRLASGDPGWASAAFLR